MRYSAIMTNVVRALERKSHWSIGKIPTFERIHSRKNQSTIVREPLADVHRRETEANEETTDSEWNGGQRGRGKERERDKRLFIQNLCFRSEPYTTSVQDVE